jgi:hypothetical protein
MIDKQAMHKEHVCKFHIESVNSDTKDPQPLGVAILVTERMSLKRTSCPSES